MKTATASSRETRRDTKSGKGRAKAKPARPRRSRGSRKPAPPKPARRVVPKRESVLVPDPSAPEGCGIEVVVPSPGASLGARSERAATAAEAASQVRALDQHGHISRSSGALGPGQTHAIETGRGGRRKLVRKRFSAT